MGAAEAGPSGRPAASGGSGKGRSKGTRPKKKVRGTPAVSASVPATVSGAGTGITGAGAGGIIGDANHGVAELARVFPTNMDEYRQGCLRLEKLRHEKLYQSEKRMHYATKAIEGTYEWELAACEDTYSEGCRALVEGVLMNNLARTQRIEEKRFGISHRPSEASIAAGLPENNDGNGKDGGKHGMSLRTRGGSGDEKDGGDDGAASNMYPVESGRPSRRSRKESAAKNGNGNGSGSSGSNGGNGSSAHAKPRVTLMMALNEEDVMSDLAKINRGKRGRDADAAPVQERRYKKRK